MKRCSKCKTRRPLDEFCKSNRSSDGKASQCKSCDKEYRESLDKNKQREYFKSYHRRNNPLTMDVPIPDGKIVCTVCNLIKIYDEFSKSKLGKFGRESQCKECRSVYHKEYNMNNPMIRKDYYANNSDKIKNYQKEYQKEFSDIIRKRRKLYYENGKDFIIYSIVYDDEIIYIGSTENYNYRIRGYKYSSYNGIKSRYNRPINKFIRENIDRESLSEHFHIIESNVDPNQLRVKEQFYIDQHGPKYNIHKVDGV